MASSSASGRNKAYRKRSFVWTVAAVLGAVIILAVLVGTAVRFLLPGTWEKGMQSMKHALQGPEMRLFRKLSVQYVEKSDMNGADKESWKARMQNLSSAFQEARGTEATREKLRVVYDAIVEEMRDANLSGKELAAHEETIDNLLRQIELEESQKWR